MSYSRSSVTSLTSNLSKPWKLSLKPHSLEVIKIFRRQTFNWLPTSSFSVSAKSSLSSSQSIRTTRYSRKSTWSASWLPLLSCYLSNAPMSPGLWLTCLSNSTQILKNKKTKKTASIRKWFASNTARKSFRKWQTVSVFFPSMSVDSQPWRQIQLSSLRFQARSSSSLTSCAHSIPQSSCRKSQWSKS